MRFGEQPLRDTVKLFPKPKNVGHPQMWYPIRLFTLWFIVQHIAYLQNINIRNSCKFIEQMGGVFEHIDADWVSWSKIALTAEQIRRLYYEAEKAFPAFENMVRSKFVSGRQARPLRASASKVSKRDRPKKNNYSACTGVRYGLCMKSLAG